MGEVVKFARVGGRRKFEACAVGDLVVGRVNHGPEAGCWAVLQIGRIDSDGAVSEILDGSDLIAVGRVFENSSTAPHWIAPLAKLKPGAVEALVRCSSVDLDDLQDLIRRWVVE